MIAVNFLYHATPQENVSNILRDGIVSKNGMIYLSKEPASWKREGDVIFRVDVTNLKGKFTTYSDDLDEIIYWGYAIPASDIALMEEGVQ